MTIDIDLKSDDRFEQTFGGEQWIDDDFINDYGFQLGNLSVCNVKGVELARFATAAINHLMLNGHRFEFVKTCEIDLPTELRIVTPNDKRELTEKETDK